jgi:hypothetical protein
MVLGTKNDRILDLISRLTAAIQEARVAGLDNTAWLLEVAILDLKTIAFAISDDDLREFTDAVADRLEIPKLPPH